MMKLIILACLLSGCVVGEVDLFDNNAGEVEVIDNKTTTEKKQETITTKKTQEVKTQQLKLHKS